MIATGIGERFVSSVAVAVASTQAGQVANKKTVAKDPRVTGYQLLSHYQTAFIFSVKNLKKKIK